MTKTKNDEFLDGRCVFSTADLVSFLSKQDEGQAEIQKASLLRRWDRSGWVRLIRKGTYLVTRGESPGTRLQALLAGCAPRQDCVLGYQAALAYHLDLPLPRTIRVLTNTHKPWVLDDPLASKRPARKKSPRENNGDGVIHVYQPVRLRPSETGEAKGNADARVKWGIVEPDVNLPLRVTNLERTLVDLFDRPEFFEGASELEDFWRILESPESLRRLAALSPESIGEYLHLVNCRITTARLGYFLDAHWVRFGWDESWGKGWNRPESVSTWEIKGLKGGRFSPRWNLVVPSLIADFDLLPVQAESQQECPSIAPGELKGHLKRIYGYDHFREGQEELIESVLQGRDALGILPTGAGKSLTYQLPALLQQGTTIVISPLLSLMEDQIEEARQRGIAAKTINGQTPIWERNEVFHNIAKGELKLLFLSPEILGGLLRPLRGLHSYIKMFVLDEAHCIHDQGKTFRPKYREVDRLKTIFNKPTLALTATADEATKEDILQVANMREAFIQQLSSYRRNLFLEARRVSKSARMDALVKQAGPDQGSGIVYAQRRDDTEMIAKHLCDQGIKAAAYHAKIAPEFKRSSQAAFMSGELQVIVATTAFGMGINKRDTRWVIHMNPPGSLSEYIQQVGRAGRDGHSARCLLMYSEWELGAMVKKAMNREDSDMRKVEIGWAHKMIAFLQSKDCRHQFICSSYGEELPECRTDGGGGHCDNCSNNK